MNVEDLAKGVSLSALNTAVMETLAKSNPDLVKATFNVPGTATTGLQGYDLEPAAKLLYPVLTPLRNAIPRVSGKGGSQANWKAVTAINTNRTGIGVAEGRRGGVIAVSSQDYAAVYKTLGDESSATFEAVNAAEGFDDLRARAGLSALQTLMLGEEVCLLGGNSTKALGTTPTPTLVAATSGGSLASATYSVIAIALTVEGRAMATITQGVLGQVSRTNADGTTETYGGGSATKSTAATVSVTGPTGKITASCAPVRGAAAYAWYWGTAGNELLGAITGFPGVVITAAAAGTQNASALSGDNSRNNLVYDGIIGLAADANSGAYWNDLQGASLTSDGAGGIVEIDAVLQRYWTKLRMSPTDIWISSTESATLTAACLAAGVQGGAFRFNVNAEQGAMLGGTLVTKYLNKYANGGNKVINVNLHPNMPQGMILFTASSIPYALNGITNVMQVKARQDYYQIEWPLRTRAYEYGVYTDCVLQHYFPPSIGVLSGIGKYQESV